MSGSSSPQLPPMASTPRVGVEFSGHFVLSSCDWYTNSLICSLKLLPSVERIWRQRPRRYIRGRKSLKTPKSSRPKCALCPSFYRKRTLPFAFNAHFHLCCDDKSFTLLKISSKTVAPFTHLSLAFSLLLFLFTSLSFSLDISTHPFPSFYL